jgi:long-chain acyl-CoA synthetase
MGQERIGRRRSYTSPAEVPLIASENLTASLWRDRDRHPERPALAVPGTDGFELWSVTRFATEVEALARGLIAAGIGPGDRVALLSGTRVEFTLLDYAIWATGAVSVPLYEAASAEQIAWIVADSGARMIVCENAESTARFRSVSERAPDCQRVLTIEEDALLTLRRMGESVADATLAERVRQTTTESVATIVYTSGTTGRPKGCVLTHGNLLWDAQQLEAAGRDLLFAGQRTLLFLPLAHIFARVIQITCIRSGVLLGFATSLDDLVEDLGRYRPDFLLAVPRVFEKVYNGARHRAEADGRVRIFDLAAATAERFSREREQGRVRPTTRLAHGVFDRLVYVRLRAALGGEVRFAISGGAALGERLGHFFNGIGVRILEGYGLTETSAGATINRPDAQRIGSVGKPLPGASVRIADDGEIQVHGPHIFVGYHGDEAATREVMTTDGWFRTGDLGHLDSEGFLFITGRKKELIVTAGGKNVSPTVLEGPLRAHPLISQAVVVGDARPFIAALITLDPDALAAWLAADGRAGVEASELVEDPQLLANVQSAIDEVNTLVSRAESIRAFRILPADFTVGVELSQKHSLRRHVILERHAAVIDAIYPASEPG